MDIHWLTVVFYTIGILIIYLLFRLLFQIKDESDPRFGQSAVLIMFGLLINAMIAVFSWGWVFAAVAVVQGLFFCWLAKNYRMTLIIANITAIFLLLAFYSGIQIYFSLFFVGSGISLISFVFEIYKLRKEAK